MYRFRSLGGGASSLSSHGKCFARIGFLAFTLAEVLITLSIIGIVAAMTIPTFIHTYKKRVVEAKLVKFYSTINNAISLAEIEHGAAGTWNISDDFLWFEEILGPYIKVSEYKFTDDGKLDYVLFLDGSKLLFDGKIDWLYYPIGNTSGHKNGKDRFLFEFYPDNTSPWGEYLKGKKLAPYLFSWDGSRETLMSNCDGSVVSSGIGKGAYCTALIWQNNWKIPDDYPYKF